MSRYHASCQAMVPGTPGFGHIVHHKRMWFACLASMVLHVKPWVLALPLPLASLASMELHVKLWAMALPMWFASLAGMVLHGCQLNMHCAACQAMVPGTPGLVMQSTAFQCGLPVLQTYYYMSSYGPWHSSAGHVVYH